MARPRQHGGQEQFGANHSKEPVADRTHGQSQHGDKLVVGSRGRGPGSRLTVMWMVMVHRKFCYPGWVKHRFRTLLYEGMFTCPLTRFRVSGPRAEASTHAENVSVPRQEASLVSGPTPSACPWLRKQSVRPRAAGLNCDPGERMLMPALKRQVPNSAQRTGPERN